MSTLNDRSTATAPLPPLADRDLAHCLTHAEDAFRALRGARLFITGGTGFYGRWALESLLYANARLDLRLRATVLTRDGKRFAAALPHLAGASELAFHPGDIRTFDAPEGSFSHVLHFATQTTAGVSALDTIDTIVCGTRRTLDAACGFGAERMLFASSGAVYGNQPPTVTHAAEDDGRGPLPSDSIAPYAEGKRLGEVLCQVYGRERGLGVVHARGFAFSGPHLPTDAHFAIGNFVRDALAGRPIVIAGDGTPVRSYLYGADLASWLWVMLVKGTAGRAYNLGSDDGRPLRDVARVVAEIAGVPVEVRTQASPDRAASRYVPSVERARTELGLLPRIGLDEGVRRWLAWLRRD
jgi:dTDP-glucose 4,6-dehydratase